MFTLRLRKKGFNTTTKTDLEKDKTVDKKFHFHLFINFIYTRITLKLLFSFCLFFMCTFAKK